MEMNSQDEKFYRRRGNDFSVISKNYSKMYEKNWDAFYMLGESKAYKDLANFGGNLEDVIVKVLKDNGFNEQTTPEKLSKLQGVSFSTFQELIGALEEMYDYKTDLANKQLSDAIRGFLPEIDATIETIAKRSEKFTPSDFIALTQMKRVKQDNISTTELLTEDKIKELGLKLARDAKPYYVKHVRDVRNASNTIPVMYYDWASIESYKHSDILEMPMSNLYSKEPLLVEEEKTFPKYEEFIKTLKQKRYIFTTTEKFYSEEDSLVIDGKKIVVGNPNLADTEKAILTMYELNKKELIKKRFFFFDNSYREAKKLFISRNNYNSNRKESFNAYKGLTRDKHIFEENKELLQDVIATLATINYARTYMTGTTFKKVESYLELQASMKLAKVSRINSTWMLPYISEKVLELSKKRYAEAGIFTIEKMKELYKNTGRVVENANTIEEVIFSKPNYLFEFTAQKNSNDKDSLNKETTQTKQEGKIYTPEELRNTATYKALVAKNAKNKQQKEQKPAEPSLNNQSNEKKPPEPEVKKEEPKAPETKATNEAKETAEIKCKTGRVMARDELKVFLDDNLARRDDLCKSAFIQASSKEIRMLRAQKVDMNTVSDRIFEKISKDIDEHEERYKKVDGNIYKQGWQLVSKYLQNNCEGSTPNVVFKKMIRDAAEEVQKNTSSGKEM